MTTREASKTAKESIPTKEKNNINARNVRFFQSLNSCLTDNTACCLPTTRRRGRRQTDGKRQRNAKINGRGMRKWVGTAGSPGTGSRKKLSNFWKQTFIQVYKYIQPCLSKIYRFWKRKKEKGNRNEIRMRRIKKEECRHRGLLKQKRITEAECKGKEQKWKCKKMGNAEMTYERREWMKKNMQNTDIKEKNPCIQLNPWRSVESYGELK